METLESPTLPKRSSRFGVGKEIGGAVYVHRKYRKVFGPGVYKAEALLPPNFEFQVVKKKLATGQFSFINSPDFDSADEPTIGEIVTVSNDQNTRRRKQPSDPYIYHHKWLFVADDYTGFDVEESKQRSASWLSLDNVDKRRIGRRSYWNERVKPLLENGSVLEKASNGSHRIARHKTAIRRPSFSLPMKCLLRDGLITRSDSVFDYGCGHGRDIDFLRDMEIDCNGWDPQFQPTSPKKASDVVNIGYVINVIEDLSERSDALKQAWSLSGKVLSVAAQLEFAAPNTEQDEFADGVLTSRGTFQKYYNQYELREYLEQEIGEDAIPAAPGVFYLFKDQDAKQQFLANRYQRRHAIPKRKISEVLFEQNKDLLEPFVEVLTSLGRLPGPEEFDRSDEVIETFGSLKRAFALVRKVTDEEPWEEIAQQRTEDVLVYLALSAFGNRPTLSKLPQRIQRDVKAFLGGYRTACARADALLFRAGDPEAIDAACVRAATGQLVDNALTVQSTALDMLEPLLRIYEGCARALVGEIEEANLIKLHRHSGKVSYISYPDFETVAHPALKLRVKVSLRSLSIDYFDYSDWDDPPLLFRKDEFLSANHDLRGRFEKLTTQEDGLDLLANMAQGFRRSHWETRLAAEGLKIQGHRVVRDSQ